MKPLLNIVRFLLMLTTLAWAASANAKVEPWRISSTASFGRAFIEGDTIGVFPANSYLANSNISIYRIRNYVSLHLNNNTTHCLPDSFECNVPIRITRWAKDSSSLGTKDTTLHVSYNKRSGTVYTEDNRWYMENMYRLHVEILHEPCDTNITRLLTLDVAMEVEYYYIMANTAFLTAYPGSFMADSVANDSSYLIHVHWTGVDFAEEYDLEWVYVDDYGTTSTTYISYSAPSFKNNASRVSIKSTSYNFHPVFEHGYVCFRIRAIGKSGTNYSHRVECDWSPITYFKVNQIHEHSKNWQYVSTFAEEGKKKEVVSYMDGSLHNRQSVTQDNDKDMSIVGETIYDSEGRAGINILPVPAFNNSLKYFNDFNLNNAASPRPYSKSDFETQVSSSCRLDTPRALSSTYGAGKYYSPSNPLASVAGDIHGYVPDAKGYPFVQVEYTPDNTGRIRRQSGVGASHVLGSGHETKYIYVTPERDELIRLFGTNVGDVTHYKKNTVIDANGQASISYLNASGKVIATALAGPPPSNLSAISSYDSSIEITSNLIATQNINNTGSSSSYNFTVLENGQPYKLYYRMSVPRFSSCLPSGNCFKGVYNLAISIEKEDECQHQYFSGWPLVRKIDQNGTILDTLCSAGPLTFRFGDDASISGSPGTYTLTDSFLVLTLGVGSYTISRTISVDEDAAERYADLFLKQSTCVKTLADFESEYLNQVDSSLCYPTCKKCMDQAGTYANFLQGWIRVIDSLGNTPIPQDTLEAQYAYNERISQCEALCDTPTVCEDYLKAMMLDVSPTGQYFKIDATDTAWDRSESINVCSAFKWGNVGLYNQPVKINGEVKTIGQLTEREFIENFDHSWARYLVVLHPEYCKYKQCVAQSDTTMFLSDFIDELNFDSALAKGYFNPTNLSVYKPTFGASSIIDPLFANRPSHIDSMMTDSLTSNIFKVKRTGYSDSTYVPLYKYIFTPTLSGVTYNSQYGGVISASYVLADSLNSRFSETDKCRQNDDALWALYKYYYLRFRRNILDKWLNDSCTFQIPAGKHRIFNTSKNVLDTLNNTPYHDNDVSSNFTEMADKQCRAYAWSWMTKLEGCNVHGSDSTKLADSLVAVCKRGTDGRNPLGATSVSTYWQKQSSPVNKNFHDVLVNFSIYNKRLCDEILIDFPGDYNHDYYATDSSYTPLDYDDTLATGVNYDYCTCATLNSLKDQFDSDTSLCTRHGFAYFVNQKYNWNFTDSQLIIIMLSCKNAPAAHDECSWPATGIDTKSHTALNKYYDSVAATIKVPPLLRCVGVKQCLNYSLVAAAVEVFVKNYGNPDTSWFLAGMLGNYLNHRFGYNLTYTDYIDFIDQYDTVFYKTYGYTVKDSSTYHNRPVFQDMFVNVDNKCNPCNKLLKGWAIWKAMDPHPTATFQEYVAQVLGFSIPFEPNDYNIDSLINHCAGMSDTVALQCNEFKEMKPYCYKAPGLDLECIDGDPGPRYVSSCEECSEGCPGKYSCRLDSFWNTVIDFCLLDSLLDKGEKSCTQLTPCEIINNVLAYDSVDAATAENLLESDYAHDFSVFDSKVYTGSNDSTIMRVICNEPSKDAKDFFENLNYLIRYDTFTVNQYISLSKTPTWRSSTLKFRFGDTCQTCIKQTDTTLIQPPATKLYITHSSQVSSHKHKFTLFLGSDTINGCRVVFDSINVSTLDSIQGFFHLKPLGPLHVDSGQRFSILAILTNADTILMTGISYCIPIAECCPPNIRSRLCNRPFFPPVVFDSIDCITEQISLLKARAYNAYMTYADSVKTAFKNHYIDSCMQHLSTHERFIMKYPLRQNHYTLYYYDQAGNLTQTVPPKGVVMLNNSDVQEIIDSAGSRTLVLEPNHTFRTNYQYNSLNQVIWQSTPDGGESKFWYDELGRLILSQNAKQVLIHDSLYDYSYTLYDSIGRIKEVGQLSKNSLTVWNGLPLSYLTHTTAVGLSTRTQITNTSYDFVKTTLPNGRFLQHYLRSRVSSVTFRRAYADGIRHATYYDYDLHGNVKSLLQYDQSLSDLGQEYKQIDYDYDLISGKVNTVIYQYNAPDAFYHHYEYDAENRLTEVYTSRDSIIWDRDANYKYYLHGPLARTEIQPIRHLQGIDYVYTIQGWIKSVNSNQLKGMRDPGKDGVAAGTSSWSNDVFGYSLSYFEGDYSAVNTGVTAVSSPVARTTNSVLASNAPNLYNGNIRSMTTSISKFMSAANKPQGMAFKYDQLNRIIEANAFDNFDTTYNKWDSIGNAMTAYKNKFTYDANGNILTQIRRGAGTTIPMDSLTYHYSSIDNKLTYVDDAVTSGNYSEDIDDQDTGNYHYDAIGNLIKDRQEQIKEIKWTVYGKISDIIRDSTSTKPDLAFEYGSDGNRVIKIVKPKNNNQPWKYTYYVRDASGNVMAVYSRLSDKKIQYDLITFSQINDTLIQDQGASSWRDFMSDTTHINKTLFSDLYIGNLLTNSLGPNLLTHFNITSAWVIGIDARIDSTLALYNFSGLLNNTLSCSFKNTFLDTLCSHFGKTFIEYSYAYDKDAYLNALYAYDAAALTNLYLNFFPVSTPMPSTASMITSIKTKRNSDVATYLYNTYGCGYNTTILATYSTATLYTIINGFNSGHGVEAVLRSLLATLPVNDVSGCFEAYDKTTFADKIFAAYPSPGFNWTAYFETQSGYYTILLTYYSLWAGYTQDNHSFYSMTDYFQWIKDKWGDTYYNNLANRFYNVSRKFSESYSVDEWDIYGSSRLGIDAENYLIHYKEFTADYSFITGAYSNDTIIADSSCKIHYNYKTLVRGYKKYELSNHLGNVLVVISDKRITLCTSSVVSGYEADIVSASDYYPFGMLMPGRVDFNKDYRYGFQLQETDEEIIDGSCIEFYKFRTYDTRLGRFWSVDPLSSKYPSNSSYSFSGNMVINSIELEGLEPWTLSSEPGGATVYGPYANTEAARQSALSGMASVYLKEVAPPSAAEQYEQKLKVQWGNPKIPALVFGLSSVGNDLCGSRLDPMSVLTLAEEEKQKIFNSNSKETIGILMSEFLEGTGQECRTFGPNTPISKEIQYSFTTSIFLQAFVSGYIAGNYSEGQYYSMTIFTSPDNSNQNPPGSPGARETAIKAFGQAFWNSPAFYTGSLDYTFTIAGGRLFIMAHNEYSIESGVTRNKADNLHRVPGHLSRLGSTQQYFNFSFDISRLKP